MSTAVDSPQAGTRRGGRVALRVFGWLMVLAVVMSAVLVAALAAWTSDAADAGLLSRAMIDIDGTRINLAQVQGEQWLLIAMLVFMAFVAAILVAVLVLPVVVLVPLAVGVLVCAGVMVAVAAVGALVLSPLILLGWGVWRLSRPRKPLATMAP
jgi:hypothetical protein